MGNTTSLINYTRNLKMMIKSELYKKCNRYLQRRLKHSKTLDSFEIKLGICINDLWEFKLVKNGDYELSYTKNFAECYKNAIDVLINGLVKHKGEKR